MEYRIVRNNTMMCIHTLYLFRSVLFHLLDWKMRPGMGSKKRLVHFMREYSLYRSRAESSYTPPELSAHNALNNRHLAQERDVSRPFVQLVFYLVGESHKNWTSGSQFFSKIGEMRNIWSAFQLFESICDANFPLITMRKFGDQSNKPSISIYAFTLRN